MIKDETVTKRFFISGNTSSDVVGVGQISLSLSLSEALTGLSNQEAASTTGC